jgi:hypothetical protein
MTVTSPGHGEPRLCCVTSLQEFLRLRAFAQADPLRQAIAERAATSRSSAASAGARTGRTSATVTPLDDDPIGDINPVNGKTSRTGRTSSAYDEDTCVLPNSRDALAMSRVQAAVPSGYQWPDLANGVTVTPPAGMLAANGVV